MLGALARFWIYNHENYSSPTVKQAYARLYGAGLEWKERQEHIAHATRRVFGELEVDAVLKDYQAVMVWLVIVSVPHPLIEKLAKS